jgi:hypothetical protein
MNKPWKVARAFQNNGPDYFVVTNGTWGARKIACLDEPGAETVRDMLTALESLFEHCAMTHKHWGKGCNQKQADAAIAAGRAAIAKAKGCE